MIMHAVSILKRGWPCFMFFSLFLAPLLSGVATQQWGPFLSNGKESTFWLPFVANESQVDDRVELFAPIPGGTVFLTREGEIVYSLQNSEPSAEINGWSFKKYLAGSRTVRPEGSVRARVEVNSIRGNDSSNWKYRLPAYETAEMRDVYKGIDLIYKARVEGVEEIFHVRSGADPETIRVCVEGANGLRLNNAGELEILTDLGPVTFTKPVAWQESPEGMNRVEAAYSLFGDEYGFCIGSYDRTKTLVIDPLLSCTFLGGSSGEWGTSILVDDSGNIYVAGDTASSNFPATLGAFDESFNGKDDVFIARFDSDLSTLQSCTFVGGSAADTTTSAKLGFDGSVYVTGVTLSADFPTTPGAYDTTHNGSSDVFVIRIDPNLAAPIASTFLGGAKASGNVTIDQDTNHDVLLFGWTSSADFPTTQGAYDEDYNGGTGVFGQGGDLFISKLDADLSTLKASTFLGGSNTDISRRMVIDTDGNPYMTGLTASSDFPITPSAYEKVYKGGGTYKGDIYISKLDASLSSLLASTFIGSTGDDWGISITLDKDGSVYVGGDAMAANYPTTPGAFDTTYNGGYNGDAIISKFDNSLTTLLASTFLGAGSSEWITGMAWSTNGSIYVAGLTESKAFPTTSGAYDESHNGNRDIFVSKLDNQLALLEASTFLGGKGHDWAMTMTLSKQGDVLITGETVSKDFPVTPGAHDTSFNGGPTSKDGDVYVAKFDPDLSADPALDTDVDGIPAGTGGAVNFYLKAGPANMDRSYLLLGSLSGTTPGTNLPGGFAVLPLNWDLFTNTILALVNKPFFDQFTGMLDANGANTAKMQLPPVPGYTGTVMYFAYALNNPWNFVSNPVAVEIIP